MPRGDAILAGRDRTYLKSLGHLGGEHRELREGEMLSEDGNAFAMSQLGAVSFDEFLKLLEISDRRPGTRSESRESRRALNFSPPQSVRCQAVIAAFSPWSTIS